MRRISPGILSGVDAAALNAMGMELESLTERFNRLMFAEKDERWIELSAYDSGKYEWFEVQADENGDFYRLSTYNQGQYGTLNGINGATATVDPAREMNEAIISVFPHYVRAEFAVMTSEGRTYYFSDRSVSRISFWTPAPRTLNSGVSVLITTDNQGRSLEMTSAGAYLITGQLWVRRVGTGTNTMEIDASFTAINSNFHNLLPYPLTRFAVLANGVTASMIDMTCPIFVTASDLLLGNVKFGITLTSFAGTSELYGNAFTDINGLQIIKL